MPEYVLNLRAFEYEQMDKVAVALHIIECNKDDAQHNINAPETIFPVIRELGGTLQSGQPIDAALFNSNYDRSFPADDKFGSFVVVMPEAFAMRLYQFCQRITIIGKDGTGYRVTPIPYEDTKAEKRIVDTDTIKWAWIDIPKGYTKSKAALEAQVTNELNKRAGLKVTKFQRPNVQDTIIPGNRCRIEFEQNEDFTCLNMCRATFVDLTYDTYPKEMRVRFNVGYCKKLQICPRDTCYKIRPDVAPVETKYNLICSCSDKGFGDGKDEKGKKRARDAGPSNAAANWHARQAAKYSKGKDPFA